MPSRHPKPRIDEEHNRQRAALELPDARLCKSGVGNPQSHRDYCRKKLLFTSIAKMGFWEWAAAQNLAKKISIWWTR